MSHKTRSVLFFCVPAQLDSLWPVLTHVKSGQAQFDTGQNGPGSQVGLEQMQAPVKLYYVLCNLKSFETTIEFFHYDYNCLQEQSNPSGPC